ncbi:glycerol-3-phosphate responsive antiterminator [Salinicoccus hispanicus]|uniref:Glycerol uptake operon antiterminator regulatory protein n=1 Tax=Salinicoccus hispanicus TaxID=157225 RepID=A0A6N8U3S2_9STAP|nr:glycerol-3-phosphate responsive antiterminator [Salinicoccus hispanicus]MXQ50861.1 glycerol-3-phosphate responsive antiterminator GlpP [Salinicoccus hispanicus]
MNILPAIRSMKDFEKLIGSRYRSCVVLDMHIGHLESHLTTIKKHGFDVYLHLDLIKGLSVDTASLEFIHQKYKPTGIVTTRGRVIKKANQLGMETILRVFVIDSSAIEKSIELIKQSEPKLIEILPGVVPKVIHLFKQEVDAEVIAGGLIETQSEVDDAIAAGAKYVTTSNTELWFSPDNHLS